VSRATGRPVPQHARIPWGLAALLACAVWLAYVGTAGGTLGTGDAVAMFEQAQSIVDRRALDVPASQSSEAWRGPDGRYHVPFGIAQALYDIPFLLAGRIAARVAPLDPRNPDTLPKAAVAMGSTVSAAVAVAAAFLLAWVLSRDRRASWFTGIAAAFATPLWPYSKYGFNAALAAAALAGAIALVAAGWTTRRRRLVALGGCAMGVAVLTRHELFIAAALALGWLAWAGRRRGDPWSAMWPAVPGVLAAALVWTVLNEIRFGHPLWTGHRPAFSFAGLPGLTISPSGSLLLYAPLVIVGGFGLLGPLKRREPVAVLIAAVSLGMFAFYAALDDWLGTRSYGPRYLLPIVPLLVAPLASWWNEAAHAARRRLFAVALLSAAVQLPPVAVDFSRAGMAAGQPPQPDREYSLRWAPLAVTAREAARALPANLRYLSGLSAPPAPAAGGDGSLGARLSYSLDFWWLYVFYLGAWPRGAALAAGLLPAALAAWMLAVGARRTAAALDDVPLSSDLRPA
jgi:hypothetical protein